MNGAGWVLTVGLLFLAAAHLLYALVAFMLGEQVTGVYASVAASVCMTLALRVAVVR